MPRTPRASKPSDAELARLLLTVAETGDLAGAAARLGLDLETARAQLTAGARRLDLAAEAAAPAGKAAGAAPSSAARRQRDSAPAQTAAAGGARKSRKGGPAVRVFCDGAARGNPGPAGAGAVIQDATGEVMARLGKYLGHTTNNVAEYQGLLLGLRHAAELGASEVQVVSDSELMVKQLLGRYKVKAPHLKPLFEEAVAALRGFDRWSVRHVLRGENSAADQMANRAVDERLDD